MIRPDPNLTAKNPIILSQKAPKQFLLLLIWKRKEWAALPHSIRSERVGPAIASPSPEVPGMKSVATMPLGL